MHAKLGRLLDETVIGPMKPHLQQLTVAILVLILLSSTAAAYKGKQLARGPVEGFELTDQHGESFAFETDAEGVVVVSFMFTRCPDVCPILTQSLIAVEAELTDEEKEDVTFVSISVDPEHDSPEVLSEYSERMGATWPHLTGGREEMEPVWETFGVVVQQNVIDMHVADYQPGEASVTLVDTANNSSHHMFAWSGWIATQLMAEEAGWSLNTSVNESGRLLHGINGVDSPTDNTWSWEFNLWNETSNSWEASNLDSQDVDGSEVRHLAWMPSNGNRSALPLPNSSDASSMSVQWPNGTQDQQGLEAFNAHHLTHSALTGASINFTIEDTTYGHYMTSINDEDAPEDLRWQWDLYAWNQDSEQWDIADVNMDELEEPLHIAWAPSSANVSAIPAPVSPVENTETVCNGHGWEMGSGASKHCMCDDGYTWAEDDQLSCVSDTTEEYNVGHSTITYILNDDLEPTIAWTGDQWLVKDFTADVRELLEKEQLGGYEADVVPSLSAALTAFALVGAAAWSGGHKSKDDQKGAKEEKVARPPTD